MTNEEWTMDLLGIVKATERGPTHSRDKLSPALPRSRRQKNAGGSFPPQDKRPGRWWSSKSNGLAQHPDWVHATGNLRTETDERSEQAGFNE